MRRLSASLNIAVSFALTALLLQGCASTKNPERSRIEENPAGWKVGQCTNIGSNYECLIYVWGKTDDGKTASLAFVEKRVDGEFSVKLRELFMPNYLKSDDDAVYSIQLDDQPALVFESWQIKTSAKRLKDGMIVLLEVPVTTTVFQMLESGKSRIKTSYIKANNTVGYSTFSMGGYIKSLLLMNAQSSRLRK